MSLPEYCDIPTQWEPYVKQLLEEMADLEPEGIEILTDYSGHLFLLHECMRKSDLRSRIMSEKIDKLVDKYSRILIAEGLHRV